MKKILLSVFLLAGFIFTGCWPETAVAPDYSSTPANKSWIELPGASSLSIETLFSKSELIDGSKGGKIKLKEKYGSNLEVEAELDIPKNAFSGTQLVTILLDDQTTSATFSPTPFVFNKSLSLSLEYEGLDLSDLGTSEIDFYYIGVNGEFILAEHDGVTVDVRKGKLKVKNASIPHFSRYGFTKRYESGD